MGMDLQLLPVEHEEYLTHNGVVTSDWGYSHSILRVDAGGWWWDALQHVQQTRVPGKFHTYVGRGEDHEPAYRDTQDTPYGDPLKCTTTGELLSAVNAYLAKNDDDVTPDNIGNRNRAVLAYLKELPATTRIALYWH